MKGFTLVEMLIVVAIIGIFMIPLLITYRSSQNNQKLRVVAEEFADQVRTVHIYARDAKDKKSWGIKLSDNGYSLLSGRADSYKVDKSFSLGKNIEFEKDQLVWFEIGTGQTDRDYEVVIVDTRGKKIAVKISKNGIVEVGDLE